MGSGRKGFRSIRVKLVGMTGLVIAAIVATSALYFPSQQLELVRSDKLGQAKVYGTTLSNQLRSAVAFSDRETAREVLSALELDDDVAYVGLFDSTGAALYERGTPSAWNVRARRGVVTSRTFEYKGRAAVIAPIMSLEGPQGTLIIEQSEQRLRHQQHVIERTAIALGIVLLSCGIFGASLVARAFVRRLHAIGDVATAIANGSRNVAVEIDTHDEIGAFAVAFNEMLEQLDIERSRLRKTVIELRDAEGALERTNRELEERVQQRTSDLRAANDQLRAEMDHRERVELELIQAQKLESVGRLAAGIAHEINTPIQFAGDSVRFIADTAPDVLGVIALQMQLVDSVLEGTDVRELALCAQTAARDVDLDFFVTELPEATAAALDGIGRVAAIVQSMKVFSYQSPEMARVDLNRAITSTITIARNEYKYIADVETELGELPAVMCHVGEINQVVLNILLNATHAIEERRMGSGGRGRIVVTTRMEAGEAVVLIRDDGLGIPDSVRNRIFEPFFTTKPVGKGTGQGLAIAYSVIVDKHHGSLSFDSERGVGTTFRISIPVEQQTERARAA